MGITYFVLTFIMGSAVGSFVNVLIDRTMSHEDWVKGRSRCDYCSKELAWYDLVPILSFCFYLGKSRCCHKKLSYRYPLVEVIVGILFLWWAAAGFVFFHLVTAPLSSLQPFFWLITGMILTILALADLFYGVVLMGVLWVGVAWTVMYRLILLYYGAYQSMDIWTTLLTSLALSLFFYVLYKATRGRGMAEGDMYIALYTGLLLGWPRGVIAIMASFVIGATISILLMVLKLKTRKDTVPFVPFMVSAIVLVLLYGDVFIRFLS